MCIIKIVSLETTRRKHRVKASEHCRSMKQCQLAKTQSICEKFRRRVLSLGKFGSPKMSINIWRKLLGENAIGI
jgi:hypothetical protein